MKYLGALLASLLMFTVAYSAEVCTTFDNGVQAFKAQDYLGAEAAWETCVAKGIHNADLFYNLGNAEYRLGHMGQAIWAYESALRLVPTSADYTANLQYAQKQIVDKVESNEEENPVLMFLWHAHHSLTLNHQLAVVGVIAWLAGILIMIFLFVQHKGVRSGILVALFVLGAVASILGIDAGFKLYSLVNDKFAIVVVKSVDVMSGPGDKYQVLHELHEGTRVDIRNADMNGADIRSADVHERRDEWVNVRIGESINGFLKADQIRIVE